MTMSNEELAQKIVSGQFKPVDGKPSAERKPVKLILVGDSAVGKSKLVERFLMSRYVPIQMSTYALTLFRYDVKVDNGPEVEIDVWDSAGQERFNSMHPAYYHEAQCAILVFDVTRKPTYKNLDRWYQELRNFRPHIPCIVACNKIDADPAVVEKTFQFAEKNELPLHYVSAAEGTNVVQLFCTAIAGAVAYRNNPHEDDIDLAVISLLKEQVKKEQAGGGSKALQSKKEEEGEGEGEVKK